MKRHIFVLLTLCFAAGSLASQEQEKVNTGLQIEGARLGTAVQNRELVGDTTSFNLNDRVYLWMKVVGGSADSITVTWKTGVNEYTSKLYVGGSPWRTWAYKTAAISGNWSVMVADGSGTVLKELNFVVQ